MSKQRIYSTKSNIEAMGVQQNLFSAGIECDVIDKRDSAYASAFGNIEIYVDKANVLDAEKVLKAYFED